MPPKKGNKRAGKPRPTLLAKGINSLSHAKTVKKSARYKWFGKGGAKKAAPAAGAGKEPRFYPADDVPVPRKSGRSSHKPTKLKGGVEPGQVLILLAGRFKGKRVVFLKQLASGTLLVTGPYAVNGVPLRRVNQVYTIATSQKVDISKVAVPAHMDDAYFKAPAEARGKDQGVLETGKAVGAVSDKRKADQKAVDDALLAAVKATPQLEGYLKARFSLKQGDRPHELKF